MYFINSRNRKHQEIFGSDAFYDLNKFGNQAKLATNLQKGDICIVASYEDNKNIIVKLSWYEFLNERSADDNKGIPCRVLCGELQKSESILKTDAAKDPRYAYFFNKLGNFQRKSVLKWHR